MSNVTAAELAGALLQTQGVATSGEGPAEVAKFAARMLGNSAKAFANLTFEDEPAGHVAAMRKNAP